MVDIKIFDRVVCTRLGRRTMIHHNGSNLFPWPFSFVLLSWPVRLLETRQLWIVSGWPFISFYDRGNMPTRPGTQSNPFVWQTLSVKLAHCTSLISIWQQIRNSERPLLFPSPLQRKRMASRGKSLRTLSTINPLHAQYVLYFDASFI